MEQIQHEPAAEQKPAKIFEGTDTQLFAYYDGLEKKFEMVQGEGEMLSQNAEEMFTRHKQINEKFTKWNGRAQELMWLSELTDAQRAELRSIGEMVMRLTNMKRMLNETLLSSSEEYDRVKKQIESIEASDTDAPERN